jgi:hypothetical protein
MLRLKQSLAGGQSTEPVSATRLAPVSRQGFAPQILAEQINFENIHGNSPSDTLTAALTAQINCACASVAGVRSRGRQSNFILKLL